MSSTSICAGAFIPANKLVVDPEAPDLIQQAYKERDMIVAFAELPGIDISKLWVGNPHSDKGRFAPIDFLCFSALTPTIGEAKIRKYKHDRFADWCIHTSKLKAIHALAASQRFAHLPDLNILLINFFEDGIALIWNLKNTKPIRQEHSDKLFFDLDKDGNRQDKTKDLSYFAVYDAYKLKYTI